MPFLMSRFARGAVVLVGVALATGCSSSSNGGGGGKGGGSSAGGGGSSAGGGGSSASGGVPCTTNAQCVIGDHQNFDCAKSSCIAGVCVETVKPSGTTCSSCACEAQVLRTCNATGECVDCNTASDCDAHYGPGRVCLAERCVLATCLDGIKNGNESDVDCGADTCAVCADGKACTNPGYCSSRVCADMVCQPASCTDLVQNGTETDVDCGGSCPTKCAYGKTCKVGMDCESDNCRSFFICDHAPSCGDMYKDGTETDVDCGGSCVTKCASGKSCKTFLDCVSQVCKPDFTCK